MFGSTTTIFNRKLFLNISIILSALLVTTAIASNKPEFDDALVVCNSRTAGHLGATASFCHEIDATKFLHLELGKRVTSIDILPTFTNGLRVPLPKRHAHIQADARSFNGFKENLFDLVFMELPPSYDVHGSNRLSRAMDAIEEKYDYTCLIPAMIKNLAPTIKSGGLLQIEHLPHIVEIPFPLAMFKVGADKSTPVLTHLRTIDPFTRYHSEHYLAFMEELGRLDYNTLKTLLLNAPTISTFRNEFVNKAIKKLTYEELPNQSIDVRSILTSEFAFIDSLPEAIAWRANKEGCFPEVIANLMATELLTGNDKDSDAYCNIVPTYAELFHLRRNMQSLKTLLEPLGFEDITITVRKKSHNGRKNVWWMQAKKK